MLFLITAALAADPATTTPEVNPTVKYLTEQFQFAIEKGLPLASEGVQAICMQIHYLGIGLLIWDSILLLMAIAAFGFAYKLVTSVRYVIEESEFFTKFFGGIIMGIIAIFMMGSMNNISEHIMMTTAPMVWALQELM